MVCSACGYENQAGHRFCGMCGVPLPHRPLTAPGANSTLDLTRVPLDQAGAQYSAAGRTGVLAEPAAAASSDGVDSKRSGPIAADPPMSIDEAVAAERAALSGEEPPPKELVPDLPLDEYVKSFRYEPPRDATEITMRGDASVQEAAAPAGETASASPSASSGAISEAAASAPLTTAASDSEPPLPVATETATTAVTPPEAKPVSDAAAAAAADVDSRLGLEPEAPGEGRSERPRFLDINEPPPDAKSGASGTSTIVGPSFLGLSDTADAAEEPSVIAAESATPPSGRGRLWLAAAIIVIVGVLGAMEWHAQRTQSGNGPVEIIRTKLRDLRHQNSEASSEAAPAAASNDGNSKPEMQVQEQPKPETPDQTAAAGSPAASSASSTSAASAPPANAAATPAPAKTPAGSQVTAEQKPPAPAKPTATPNETPAVSGDQPSAKQTAEASKPAASTETAAAPAKSKADSPAADAAGLAAPGADEMTKAKNASDSAAEAAWLWKATAKGNPDAPVQLADMYVKGDGVPRSCEQAVVLLKTAAAKDNARARNRLAAMYATGSCVPRNRVEAYRWVSSALAVNPNSQWAQQNRDLLWQQMTPDERAAAGKYR